ncbi:MAG: hypothetical protein FD128_1938, partial [Hyphomonadaceae bacterium]
MPNNEIETLDDELPNDVETEAMASETEVVAEMSVEEELLACRAEIEKLKDAALRAMAEGENIRRRSERDRTDA